MVWTNIIIEGYCGRTWSCKKDKYLYIYNVLEKGDYKTEKKINPCYDPNYKTPRKPRYCKGIPNYVCLEKMCPHFGYADAEKEAYLFLNKFYKKNHGR